MDTSSGPTGQWLSTSPGVLSRGAHLAADDGACVMEAVSVAAQLPWTDAPACTDPLLAHLARLVNDAMSDEGREALATFIPELVTTRASEPDCVALVSARVAAACTAQALRLRPTLLLLHLYWVVSAEVRCENEYTWPAFGRGGGLAVLRRGLVRTRRLLFERGPGARSVEAAVASCLHLPERERDAALLGLLRSGLDATCPTTLAPGAELRGQQPPESVAPPTPI